MAATTLTPQGWTGASSGVWTNLPNLVVDDQRGIRVSGSELINALDGDDLIRGERGSGAGISIPRNQRRSNLQLGSGNDTVIGRSASGSGINNRGFLFMGAGRDRITGTGGDGGLALRNRGYIFTQSGRDVVDVNEGSVLGGGFIDLGGGPDTFIGFGNHTVYGGGNIDTLLLPKGRYDLRRSSSRRHELERNDNKLTLFDFERIGSINGRKDEQLDIDRGGTLVVKANGDITLS